jgi:hypothetical protein
MATFLLLHPPLLGPSVWAPCAQALTEAGHRAVVPDLRPALDPPSGWHDRAATRAAHALAMTAPGPAGPAAGAAGPAAGAAGPAAGAAGPAGPAADTPGPAAGGSSPRTADLVVVGHSGAGVVLPVVADRVGAGAAVFVDAQLPGNPTSDRFRGFLAGLPGTDGRLPRWSDWWGPEAMAEIVPDPDLRQRIEADQPRLPLAFWDERVPVPPSWPPPRVGYLQLSSGYETEAAGATAQGWPVRILAGEHLDLATRPAETATEIVALAT